MSEDGGPRSAQRGSTVTTDVLEPSRPGVEVTAAGNGRGARVMPGAAHVVAEHNDLRVRTQGLIREFHPLLSAGEVITTVARCRQELMRSGLRRGLATTTEATARARLDRRLGGTRRGINDA
jgi:hypothetical protein